MKCVQLKEIQEHFNYDDETMEFLGAMTFRSGATRELFVDLDDIPDDKPFKAGLLKQWERSLQLGDDDFTPEGQPSADHNALATETIEMGASVSDSATSTVESDTVDLPVTKPAALMVPADSSASSAVVSLDNADRDRLAAIQAAVAAIAKQQETLAETIESLATTMSATNITDESGSVQLDSDADKHLCALETKLKQLEGANQSLRDDRIAAKEYAKGVEKTTQEALGRLERVCRESRDDTAKAIEAFYRLKDSRRRPAVGDYLVYVMIGLLSLLVALLAFK